MSNFVYIEKVAPIKIIVGNLLVIPSILAFILSEKNQSILPLIYLIVAYWGIFLISTEGIKIDFENKRYRKLFSIYGINIGKSWNYFPEIQYAALLETTVKQTFGGRGFRATATTTITEKTVKINLFDNNEKHFTLYFANNRMEALKIAEKFKQAYKIEIFNNFK